MRISNSLSACDKHMKNTKEVQKKLGIALVLQLLVYALQFIIIPVFYYPHPMEQTAGTVILCITTIVMVWIGTTYLLKRIWYWIVSFPIYPFLIKLYHPKDAYGIGYDGYLISFTENFDIIFISLFIIIVEILTCIVVKVLYYIIKKFRK